MFTLMLAALFAAATPAPSAAPAAPALATANFAGGCFWSMESAFEGKPGVKTVVSGFTGGSVANPSYEEVSSGTTGHLEAIQVTYDPRVTSYAKLLDIYWHNIDPMQSDGQFYDRAPEYHTEIFYSTPGEKEIAEQSLKSVAAKLKKPIATKLAPALAFYPAEEYHQDYYKKNPEHYMAYRRASGRDARLKQIWGVAPVIAH